MSVSHHDPQKVALIRNPDMLEEAFLEKWGEGAINRIIMVGRRVGTSRSALVAHWGDECI